MTFPTPWTVSHEVFTGWGEDPDTGNDVPTWADPVDRKVIGWSASYLETLDGHTSRVESDIDLLIPPTFTVSAQDRFNLPDTGQFDVVAVEDSNHGFHGWKPGSVVKLKRITG